MHLMIILHVGQEVHFLMPKSIFTISHERDCGLCILGTFWKEAGVRGVSPHLRFGVIYSRNVQSLIVLTPIHYLYVYGYLYTARIG